MANEPGHCKHVSADQTYVGQSDMWQLEWPDVDCVAGWDPNGESGNHCVYSHATGLYGEASDQSFFFSLPLNKELFYITALMLAAVAKSMPTIHDIILLWLPKGPLRHSQP